jgi:protein-tyrosine phosphatase
VKYGTIFITFSVLCIYGALSSNNFTGAILIYLSINFAFLSITYFSSRPELLGKKSDGTAKWFPRLLNFPWYLISQVVWRISILISKEECYHAIPSTKISIGRKFLSGELPPDTQVLIDLTSEFSEAHHKVPTYISLPMLDGVAPSSDLKVFIASIIPIIESQNTYIHCVQGHGRTATFTSLLLSQLNKISPMEAYESILNVRPEAKASSSQLTYLGQLTKRWSGS